MLECCGKEIETIDNSNDYENEELVLCAGLDTVEDFPSFALVSADIPYERNPVLFSGRGLHFLVDGSSFAGAISSRQSAVLKEN